MKLLNKLREKQLKGQSMNELDYNLYKLLEKK
jgi:hypothetical protein